MKFLSALVVALRAVPKLIKLVDRFFDLWIDAKIANDMRTISAEQKKLAYIKKQIREAKTDEERLAFSIILSDYNSGKVQ